MTFYIIIRGPLGIGKSTIAERLSKELKAKYVPIDRILDEHDLTRDKEEGYISQRSFKKVNEIAVKRVKRKLENGNPVVFDGNFYWKSQIEDLIERLDFPHYVFTLNASLEACIKRDAERAKTHGKDAAEAVYKKSTSFTHGETINTEGKNVDDVVNEIKKRLKN